MPVEFGAEKYNANVSHSPIMLPPVITAMMNETRRAMSRRMRSTGTRKGWLPMKMVLPLGRLSWYKRRRARNQPYTMRKVVAEKTANAIHWRLRVF